MTERMTKPNSVNEYESELFKIYLALRDIQTQLIELNLNEYKRSYPKFYWNTLKGFNPEYFDTILKNDPFTKSIWEFIRTRRGCDVKYSKSEISECLNLPLEEVKQSIGQLIDLYMYPILEENRKYYYPVTVSELQIFLNDCWDSMIQECFELLESDSLVTELMIGLHGIKIMMEELPVVEATMNEQLISK